MSRPASKDSSDDAGRARDRQPATRGAQRRSQAERRGETERKLLAAATRLIAERGSSAVSLADVGHEAGYSRGIVNHQFGTKRALLEAVVSTAQSAFAPDDVGNTGLESLLLIVRAYIRHLFDDAPNGQAALLLWAESLGSRHMLSEFFIERDEWFRSRIAEHLAEGLTDGTVRSDLDVPAVAVAIVAMLRGVGLQLISTPGLGSEASVEQQTVELVRRGVSSTPKDAVPNNAIRPPKRAARTR